MNFDNYQISLFNRFILLHKNNKKYLSTIKQLNSSLKEDRRNYYLYNEIAEYNNKFVLKPYISNYTYLQLFIKSNSSFIQSISSTKFAVEVSNFDIIEIFRHKINFGALSENESIEWSIEFLNKYIEKWNWSKVSLNKKLPWSIELIEKFKNKWVWSELAKNNVLPWSSKLLYLFEREFVNKYDVQGNVQDDEMPIYPKWYYFNSETKDAISKNTLIPWSIDLIRDYEYMLNWDIFSQNENLPWTIELIESFIDKWNWSYLSSNKSILWTEKLISKFERKWDWDVLSENEEILWNDNLLIKYSESSLIDQRFDEYDGDCINTYMGWNFKKLSTNPSIIWSDDLILRLKVYGNFIEDIHWIPITWTEELIDEFQMELNFFHISSWKCVNWTKSLISKYVDKWYWPDLSQNESLPWSTELILEFETKWSFDLLSYNMAIKWDRNMVNIFFDRLNLSIIRFNKSFDPNNYDDKFLFSNLPEVSSINLYNLISSVIAERDYFYLNPYSRPTNDEFYLEINNLCSGNYYGWNTELLEHFQSELNWEELSQNVCLPWSVSLLEAFKNLWNWNLLSSNESIFWDDEMLYAFKELIKWRTLLENTAVIWNAKRITKLRAPLNLFDDKLYESIIFLSLDHSNNEAVRLRLIEFQSKSIFEDADDLPF